MSPFNLIVLLSIGTLAWNACALGWQLGSLRRRILEELRVVERVNSRLGKGATWRDAAPAPEIVARGRMLLATFWQGMLETDHSDSAAALDRTEERLILPLTGRVGGIVQIAPAVGLLFTAASITVGFYGAGDDPVAASAALIAVLPVALMSTVAALAIAIALRLCLGRLVTDWQRLRGAVLGLTETRARDRYPRLRPASTMGGNNATWRFAGQ